MTTESTSLTIEELDELKDTVLLGQNEPAPPLVIIGQDQFLHLIAAARQGLEAGDIIGACPDCGELREDIAWCGCQRAVASVPASAMVKLSADTTLCPICGGDPTLCCHVAPPAQSEPVSDEPLDLTPKHVDWQSEPVSVGECKFDREGFCNAHFSWREDKTDRCLCARLKATPTPDKPRWQQCMCEWGPNPDWHDLPDCPKRPTPDKPQEKGNDNEGTGISLRAGDLPICAGSVPSPVDDLKERLRYRQNNSEIAREALARIEALELSEKRYADLYMDRCQKWSEQRTTIATLQERLDRAVVMLSSIREYGGDSWDGDNCSAKARYFLSSVKG